MVNERIVGRLSFVGCSRFTGLAKLARDSLVESLSP